MRLFGRWIIRMRNVHTAMVFIFCLMCIGARLTGFTDFVICYAVAMGYSLARVCWWSERELSLRAILGQMPFDVARSKRREWYVRMERVVQRHLAENAPTQTDASSINLYIRDKKICDAFGFNGGYQDIRSQEPQLLVVPKRAG